MLVIKGRFVATPECQYICRLLITDFWGLQWRSEFADVDDFSISVEEQIGEIRMPATFFKGVESHWLKAASLPRQPLETWNIRELKSEDLLVDSEIPIIYGCGKCADIAPDAISIPIDIFGSAFFMLSRYEELVLPERDRHDRFPATASLAKQEGFLERPIIDEYLEILWAAISQLWGGLQRKRKTPILRVTCDVDSPYQNDFSLAAMGRGFIADIFTKGNINTAVSNVKNRFGARRGDFTHDPHHYTFDWMMNVNEKAGNQVAFYFITGGNHQYDAVYSMGEKVIQSLLLNMHQRGHEIGLHPSYMTYQDEMSMCEEAKRLHNTLDKLNIASDSYGGRQHFLRWQTPVTARNWEAAKMSYDSTLGYAEFPGFRCGTSREFCMYDLELRRPLRLKQRPLILMEVSVLAGAYMGLGYSEHSLEYMLKIRDRALKFGRECTILWHNSTCHHPAFREFYTSLINYSKLE